MNAEWMVELLKNSVAADRKAICKNLFSYDQGMQQRGAKPYNVLTSWCWYRRENDKYVTDRVHAPTAVRAVGMNTDPTSPAVVELESWDVKVDTQHAIQQVVTALSLWKVASSRPIGVYRLCPDLDYWSPVLLSRALAKNDAAAIEACTARIARTMALHDQLNEAFHPWVDFYTPQAYVQYSGDQTEWRWATAFSILESARLARGKPVRPIAWYHAQASNKELTAQEYADSLRFVASFPRVEGIYLYSACPEPALHDWRDTAEALLKV